MDKKLHPIQLKILNYLSMQKGPVSAQFLANSLGVSSKTIRNYLNNLISVINPSDFIIESKTGQGYKLIIYNQHNFSEFIKKNMLCNPLNTLTSVQNERIHFIIRHLLSSETYTKIEELEDLLYVNRMTVKQALNSAKEILEKFQLEIVTKSRHGIKIKGSEHDIRLCINYEFGHYFKRTLSLSRAELYGELYDFDKDVQLLIENTICYYQKLLANFNLSSFSISTIARIIQISAVRNKKGNCLTYSEAIKDGFANKNINYAAQTILNKCAKILQYDFINEDVIFFTICLSGFNVILSKDNMHISDYRENMNMAFELVQYLEKINDFNYIGKDIKLIDDVALYLNSLIVRSKYHIYTTQFDYEVNSDCSLMSRKLAMQAFAYLHEKYGVVINKAEIEYLAMIIHPVFGRFPTIINKVKACCVSNVDKRIGKGIAGRLMRNFEHYIEQVDLLDLYELKEKDLNEYDILFTSYTLDKLNFLPKHITVFQLDIFWGDIIKRNIRFFLVNKVLMKNYQLRQYFQPKWLFKDVTIKKGEKFIDVMCRYLKDDLTEPEIFKQDLYDCETIMESKPRDNVVFLSGMKSHTDTITIAIFILKHPISWNQSLQKAQILVYWDRGRVPHESRCFENAYIPHLLSEVFRSRLVINELIKNPNYEQVINRMEEYFQNYLT